MTDLTFTVHGVPVPQGSHKAFVVNGRAVITQDNKRTKPWRAEVAAAALDAIANDDQTFPYTCPVAVEVAFLMPRPGYHFRTGKHAHELKPGAPAWHDKKPDCDKLERSLLDALTAAGVFRDDAQVADLHAVKVYADGPPGARVTVTPLTAVAVPAPPPSESAATVQEALL
jgi:Holliday junction resolvase RusA-like endonuclease